MNTQLATDPQITFLRKLDTEYCDLSVQFHVAEGQHDEAEVVRGMMEIIEEGYAKLTKREASARIDRMKNEKLPALRAKVRAQRPVVAAPKPEGKREELEDGIYLFEGKVVKVVHAIHGSGNQYASVLNPENRTPTGKARFEYTAGLVRKLTAAMKMTKAQGLEYGELYGMCVSCGATLTADVSIERAMGPICAGKLR